MDRNKKIYESKLNPSQKNPLGGVIHISDFVELESDISFLDNYLEDGLQELSDIEKLKVMDYIDLLTKGRVSFKEALSYIYFSEKRAKSVIKKMESMRETLLEMEKIGVHQKGDLLENIQDYFSGSGL